MIKRFKLWLRGLILSFLGLDVRLRELEKDVLAVQEKQLDFEEQYPLTFELPDPEEEPLEADREDGR
jgi:hypothetical protein